MSGLARNTRGHNSGWRCRVVRYACFGDDGVAGAAHRGHPVSEEKRQELVAGDPAAIGQVHEMDVGVDETGNHVFSASIDALCAARNR